MGSENRIVNFEHFSRRCLVKTRKWIYIGRERYMRFFTCDLFRVAEYFADLKSRLRNASLKNIILLNIPFSAFRVKTVVLVERD